jgi:hypothetical protein
MNRTLHRVALAAALAGACLLAATAIASAVTLPPTNTQFDYQIGGAYTPLSEVSIVDRDRNAAPVSGKYNICYVNAFQTQPEESEWWIANHNELLLKNANGRYIIDGQWNEILLDISTAAKREAIAEIVGGWIDGCRTSGFNAVEPDNLESWTRSRRLLTQTQAVAYATILAARAHSDELAIAQKNTSEIGTVGKLRIGFDFAIAEECHAYRECGEYMEVFGTQVYEIEYEDNGGLTNFNSACTDHGARISIIFRDRLVTTPSEGRYLYRWC